MCPALQHSAFDHHVQLICTYAVT